MLHVQSPWPICKQSNYLDYNKYIIYIYQIYLIMMNNNKIRDIHCMKAVNQRWKIHSGSIKKIDLRLQWMTLGPHLVVKMFPPMLSVVVFHGLFHLCVNNWYAWPQDSFTNRLMHSILTDMLHFINKSFIAYCKKNVSL